MLVAVALLLQIQSVSASPLPTMSRSDSIAARQIIARARREEAKFFVLWRREWQNQRDLVGTDPRFWSLHCHYDDVEIGDERHVITSGSRKSMCPIWFQEYGTRGDESINIDNAIPAKSLAKVRSARANVIALLDSAARLDPGNLWVLGQRIRLYVDQKEYARAAILAAEHCHGGALVCTMLEGYVLAQTGNRKGAETAFEYAAAALSPGERCRYLDASVFFEGNERVRSEAMKCEERLRVDERFWWLADPLWIKRGNERLAIHLERHILLLLKASLTADEHFDYRVKYGGQAVAEMLLRYGWPSVSFHDRTEHENHNDWLRFRDSASNASHEYFRPRYHTTPGLAVLESLGTVRGPELADIAAPWIARKKGFDESWWPIEHFPRPGAITAIDYQAAILRRARGPIIAVAADPRSQRLSESMLASYTTALVAMSEPADPGRSSTTATKVEAGGAAVATLNIRPGIQVISAEMLDLEQDSAPVARARFAVTAPPGLDSLGTGALGISDAILFAAPPTGDLLPRSANAAIERMLPSTELRDPSRVGVFFEMYGLAANEPVDVTLTVISANQPGFLRALGSRIGIGQPAAGSFVVRWEAGQAGTSSGVATIDGAVLNTRAIVLDLEALRGGKYALEIGVARSAQQAVTRRELVIRR